MGAPGVSIPGPPGPQGPMGAHGPMVGGPPHAWGRGVWEGLTGCYFACLSANVYRVLCVCNRVLCQVCLRRGFVGKGGRWDACGALILSVCSFFALKCVALLPPPFTSILSCPSSRWQTLPVHPRLFSTPSFHLISLHLPSSPLPFLPPFPHCQGPPGTPGAHGIPGAMGPTGICPPFSILFPSFISYFLGGHAVPLSLVAAGGVKGAALQTLCKRLGSNLTQASSFR